MTLLLALWACTPEPDTAVASDPDLPSVALVTWTSD